ncbi:unnamed protein product [Amoebophrya sp. A120]|nr:unnamed protein product [Amoebophrya sp. A120]|eukprot:GSA120T00015639001.1
MPRLTRRELRRELRKCDARAFRMERAAGRWARRCRTERPRPAAGGFVAWGCPDHAAPGSQLWRKQGRARGRILQRIGQPRRARGGGAGAPPQRAKKRTGRGARPVLLLPQHRARFWGYPRRGRVRGKTRQQGAYKYGAPNQIAGPPAFWEWSRTGTTGTSPAGGRKQNRRHNWGGKSKGWKTAWAARSCGPQLWAWPWPRASRPSLDSSALAPLALGRRRLQVGGEGNCRAWRGVSSLLGSPETRPTSRGTDGQGGEGPPQGARCVCGQAQAYPSNTRRMACAAKRLRTPAGRNRSATTKVPRRAMVEQASC